jgi:excisionase family DNA binding protein
MIHKLFAKKSRITDPKGLTMTETISSQLLLKPKEAAEALRISERTLWQLTKDKEIPCVKVGGRIRQVVRYDPRDLQAWIDKKKQGSVSGAFVDQSACPVGKRP